MRILICIVFVVSFFQNTFAQEIGQKSLPSVVLKETNGAAVNINSYATNGKITIISFWATWCKPCLMELNAVADVYEDWVEEYDVEFVAVSTDNSRNSSKVKAISKAKGWPFEILLDPNENTKRAFNFVNVPYVIIVDKSGRIVYQHNGYLPGDEEELEEKLAELTK